MSDDEDKKKREAGDAAKRVEKMQAAAIENASKQRAEQRAANRLEIVSAAKSKESSTVGTQSQTEKRTNSESPSHDNRGQRTVRQSEATNAKESKLEVAPQVREKENERSLKATETLDQSSSKREPMQSPPKGVESAAKPAEPRPANDLSKMTATKEVKNEKSLEGTKTTTAEARTLKQQEQRSAERLAGKPIEAPQTLPSDSQKQEIRSNAHESRFAERPKEQQRSTENSSTHETPKPRDQQEQVTPAVKERSPRNNEDHEQRSAGRLDVGSKHREAVTNTKRQGEQEREGNTRSAESRHSQSTIQESSAQSQSTASANVETNKPTQKQQEQVSVNDKRFHERRPADQTGFDTRPTTGDSVKQNTGAETTSVAEKAKHLPSNERRTSTEGSEIPQPQVSSRQEGNSASEPAGDRLSRKEPQPSADRQFALVATQEQHTTLQSNPETERKAAAPATEVPQSRPLNAGDATATRSTADQVQHTESAQHQRPLEKIEPAQEQGHPASTVDAKPTAGPSSITDSKSIENRDSTSSLQESRVKDQRDATPADRQLNSGEHREPDRRQANAPTEPVARAESTRKSDQTPTSEISTPIGRNEFQKEPNRRSESNIESPVPQERDAQNLRSASEQDSTNLGARTEARPNAHRSVDVTPNEKSRAEWTSASETPPHGQAEKLSDNKTVKETEAAIEHSPRIDSTPKRQPEERPDSMLLRNESEMRRDVSGQTRSPTENDLTGNRSHEADLSRPERTEAALQDVHHPETTDQQSQVAFRRDDRKAPGVIREHHEAATNESRRFEDVEKQTPAELIAGKTTDGQLIELKQKPTENSSGETDHNHNLEGRRPWTSSDTAACNQIVDRAQHARLDVQRAKDAGDETAQLKAEASYRHEIENLNHYAENVDIRAETKGNHAFYAKENRSIAEAFCEKTVGYWTLDKTSVGIAFREMKLYRCVDETDARTIWGTLSCRFGSDARGIPVVFDHGHPKVDSLSQLYTHEFPELGANPHIESIAFSPAEETWGRYRVL